MTITEFRIFNVLEFLILKHKIHSYLQFLRCQRHLMFIELIVRKPFDPGQGRIVNFKIHFYKHVNPLGSKMKRNFSLRPI